MKKNITVNDLQVQLNFNKIYEKKNRFWVAKTHSMPKATYEEYEKNKHPETLLECYYCSNIHNVHYAITDKILSNELRVQLIKCLNERYIECSYDIWFTKNDIQKAVSNLTELINSFRQFYHVDNCSIPTDIFVQNETNNNLYTFKSYLEMLTDFNHYVKTKNVNIIIGKPGTGKTHYAIDQLLSNKSKNVKVVTLSNLVGASFKHRAENSGVSDIDFSSYTRERFVDSYDFDWIVFEEASMLSMNEMPIILNNMNRCNNIMFLGDTQQLPSFLRTWLYPICSYQDLS